MKNKCDCGTGHFGYHDVSCAINRGFVPEAGAGNRCCCGKYSDVDGGGFISNKIQHMPINTGSFCGPVDHHIIATLHDKIKELEGDLDIIQKENMQMMVDSFDYVPTRTHMKLVRRFKELEADKERIDWLGSRCKIVERPGRTTSDWCFNYMYDVNLRAAIDKARK